MQALATYSDIRYTLRGVNTTSATLPASALFMCFKGKTLLGHVTFVFGHHTESAVWAFWKPVLEGVIANKEFTLELDGGRFVINPPPPDGEKSVWCMALPPPSQEESNIKIYRKE